MSYTIGIDLGGTTMTAGLVNEDYEIVGKITWATRLPRPAEDLEKAMADLCREVAKQNGVDFSEVRYVGIGTPGSVNFTTGFVGYNTNFNYYDWNLGTDLEALLGCKVYVENDANAAAFGEYIAGGAKGYKDAVVITLGTGIGSGIILDGKTLRGFNFAAGEMVQHKAFGRGMILTVLPMGNDALLEIAFDGVGTKRLMANTASQHMKKL